MLGEDRTDDHNLKLEMNNDLEIGAYLDDTPKAALNKLIHAAKLHTSLKTLEEERNQISIQLSKINKTRKDLRDHLKHLLSEQASLQSEDTHFERENQKLQQQLKVITELYQETAMRLYKKLENEEKLSKVDRNINYTTDQLENYRKQAKDLEGKLERMSLSYQERMIPYKKKNMKIGGQLRLLKESSMISGKKMLTRDKS
ncbi:Melanoma inhibitory activity protein 2 [Plecturocebus cupreus]